MPRFEVPVEFQRLDDVDEHGHDAVVALTAELDGADVGQPDEQGVFVVELEAESLAEARDRVWHGAEQARITDFIDFVGDVST